MRAFLAFEIAPELKEILQKSKQDLQEKIGFDSNGKSLARRIIRENLHCTILFFNDLPEKEIENLKDFLLNFSKISFNNEEIVEWQEFQHWKEHSLICLFGQEIQCQRLNWLRENLPENIQKFGRFDHLKNWRPHITLLRGSSGGKKNFAENHDLFKERSESLFPISFAGEEIYSFKEIALFKSPPNQQSGIYERLFTVKL